MLENSNDLDILFVNGVNTAIGGSVAESNKIWAKSFFENRIHFKFLDTVPKFLVNSKNIIKLFCLSFYFMPGTIFRIVNSPILEFLYKLSIFLTFNFCASLFRCNPTRVIFSHHCIFYLSIFCARAKRVFLIHDLMYIRSRSRGGSRRLQRFYFSIEKKIYQFAPTVLVQSYHEWRVLSRFLDVNIQLVGCCDLDLDPNIVNHKMGIAVISDWRRPENRHGALEFFCSNSHNLLIEKKLTFTFYGYGAVDIIRILNKKGLPTGVNVVCGGYYQYLSDIKEAFFFIPIYHGAGIKRKMIEAICAGRLVLGTRAAFIGVPFSLVSSVAQKVNTLKDLESMPEIPELSDFSNSLKMLSYRFNSIGEVAL